MSMIKSLLSFFRKEDGTDTGNQEAVKRLTQELLQKLMKRDIQGATSIVEETNSSDETRAKVISFCEALADAGLKPARQALTIALQRSPVFREREEEALPNIRMTAVHGRNTIPEICERVRTAMPHQVFVTGGGIFNEVVPGHQDFRDALGDQYSVRLLNTDSKALTSHSLIALRQEIRAHPSKRNFTIGVYPGVSWFPFLQLPSSSFDLFSPWPWQEYHVAVFLIGALSYAYVIEVSCLINGEHKAPGFLENLVSTGDPRLTNKEYEQIQNASSSGEQAEVLWRVSREILKTYEKASSSAVYTGPPGALEVLKHGAFVDMYISRGMYQNAISELEKAIDLERDRRILADHYVNLALCYAHLEKFNKTVSPLQRASRMNPSLASEAQKLVEQIQHTVRGA